MSIPEYRPASDRVLTYLTLHRAEFSQNVETESRVQAVFAAIQLCHPTKNLCDIERLISLLPCEPAFDALCLLAYVSPYRLTIAQNLSRVEGHLASLSLFSLVTLLRNLSLSSLDKALLAAPSAYSDTEIQQAKSLFAAAGQTQPETEEQTGVTKQLIVASGVLPAVMKQCWKARKTWSQAMGRTWLEAVFALSEVKEARGLLLAHEALTGVLKSENKGLAGHTAARLLLTTNPALLAESQLQDAAAAIRAAISDSRHELVDFECALALVNLSGFQAELRDQLVGLQTHRVALDLLSSENELIRRTGLELACNLSASEVFHSEIERSRSLDVVQAFVALVDSEDEYTSYLAVSSLANIGHLDGVKGVVGRKEGLRARVQQLEGKFGSQEWRARVAALSASLGWSNS